MKNKLRRRLFVLLFLSLVCKNTSAQMASGIPYLFSADSVSNGFSGTTLINLSIRPTIIKDEFDTLLSPFGFNFNFAGINYSKIIVSTNGWLALAPSNITTLPPYFTSALPNNSLSNYSGGLPLIAPLWDDDSCNIFQYGVVANVLSVRWLVKWAKDNTNPYTALFWVQLDGNTGTITFNYNNLPYTASLMASASIGIAGICQGDFYSVTPGASFNLATVDSITENASINLKPSNSRYIFTPYQHFDNCSGISSAEFLGSLSTICVQEDASNIFATSSGITNCSTTDFKDVWFKYFKPTGVNSVTVSTMPASCNSVTGTSLEIYADCGGAPIGCSTNSLGADSTFAIATVNTACAADTIYVRVTGDGDAPGKFKICAQYSGSLVNIDDGNPCTIDDCDPATSVPVHFPVNIDDLNGCTLDACDSTTGIISHTPDLDDNNPCTGDFCDTTGGNGVVVHIPIPNIFLGNDTTLQSGTTLLLNVGAGFNSYLWSAGQTTDTIQVNQSGTYVVTVADQNGCSATDSITITFITGVAATESNTLFYLYPNPGNGKIGIHLNASFRNFTIRIFDLPGNLLFEEYFSNANEKLEINSELTQGTYILQLQSEDRIYQKKLLIVKNQQR